MPGTGQEMNKNKNGPSLFSSIMLAYLILLLHVLIVAGIGVLIIFFRGVVAYTPLILLGGLSIVGASAYYIYRRFKTQGRNLRETLNSPLFRGKSVEINLLGGMASIKIDSKESDTIPPAIEAGDTPPLLEDPESKRIRDLVDLARSLENDHISQKTTKKTGRNLFN